MVKRTTAFASSMQHLARVHRRGRVLSVYFMKVFVKSLLRQDLVHFALHLVQAILLFVVRMVKRTAAIASSLRHLARVQRQEKVLSVYFMKVLVYRVLHLLLHLELFAILSHVFQALTLSVVRMEKRTRVLVSS
jgi:hypothetical protein